MFISRYGAANSCALLYHPTMDGQTPPLAVIPTLPEKGDPLM
ncbi:hypothetical protein ACUNV4_28070 [Granulosicoccus sp. 3-233]